MSISSLFHICFKLPQFIANIYKQEPIDLRKILAPAYVLLMDIVKYP